MTDEPIGALISGDPADEALRRNVHPPDWVNPEPARRYDLVVIGAGTAGLVTAAGAAGLGAKVALVEKGFMGGDCLNFGCVPSKALLRSARAAADVRAAGQFGVVVPEAPTIDFSAVMERVRRLRAEISPHDSAARFRDLGVDVFFGTGRFVSPEAVEVAGNLLRFRHAVIATGARPNRPPIPGLDEAGYLTNETIFALTQLPARLAVIGAGPVGCELAQAFARLGSRVTLYSREARLLPRDDAEAAALVEHALVGDGVVVRHLCRVERITRSTSRDKIIHCVVGNQSVADAVDAILIGVGRRPNVRNLGLESAGVAYDEREGVRVDDRLRTTQRRIFAAGDVCSRFQFTHAADAMARIVIQNACFLGRARASLLTVPWCTYTDPEIAHVGLSEADAAARGLSVTTFTQRMNAVDRSVLDGEPDGFVKVHVRTGTDRLVGATIVARHAGEMISELTLAMVGGLGMRTVARTIHPYPTRSEAIKKTADAYNRARLTPFVQNLLRRWFTWRP